MASSAESMLRIIIRAIDQYSPVMNTAAKQTRMLGQTMSMVGAGLTAAVTVPLVAAGAAGVKMAVDLDESMRNIQSIGKQTEAELKGLEKRFISMSMNAELTRDSAYNLAEGFYFIQGSGFAGADAMTVLEASTKAASAGMTETEVAADALTSVLLSYGKGADEAEYISDLLFRTVDRGKGTFDELATSISYVTPTAAAVGVEFDEVSAALSALSKQGTNFGTGAIRLNQIMMSLLKPSEDMQGALRALGYESGSAMLQANGLAGTLELLWEHTGQNADKMALLFKNTRGYLGVMQLVGPAAQDFQDDLAAMGEATGATQAAFEIQMKSFAAQLDVFMNTLNAFLIQVGQIIIPALTTGMNLLMPILQALANAPRSLQTLIVFLGLAAAAVGPLLVVLGQVLIVISSIGPAITMISGALPALGAALSAIGAAIGALALPVAAILVAIGALVAMFIRFRGEASYAERALDSLKMIAQIVGAVFQQLGRQIAQAFAGLTEALRQIGSNAISALVEGIKSRAQEFIDTMRSLAERAVAAVKGAFKIRSDSRVMMDVAKHVVSGYQRGLQTPLPAQATTGMAVSALGGRGGAGGLGAGLVIHGGLHVHASDAAGGREAADEFLRTVMRKAQGKRGVTG